MAELVMAALATADLCLKYGKILVELYHDFKEADIAVREKIIFIEATWCRTEKQIEVLETLNVKLLAAVARIKPLAAKRRGPHALVDGIMRLKYVLVRESLDKALAELERWRDVFDPTWYLIVLNKSEDIDSELLEDMPSARAAPRAAPRASPPSALATARNLRQSMAGTGTHVNLDEAGLDWASAPTIRYTTTQIIQRASSERRYLVDTIACGGGDLDVPRTRANAETMAMKLKQLDPKAFGLLACQGLVKRRDPATEHLASINLIFRPQATEGARLISLREELRSQHFVHTCGFVHKNIRPETIVLSLTEDDDDASSPGSAFLLGFDQFRSAHFQTLRQGDAAWERNLYRHPQRQGMRMNEDYVMQHDVYALGACLLEIGLWSSFVVYSGEADGTRTPSSALRLKLCDEAFTAENAVILKRDIKEHLVELAREKLPQRMGDLYTAVVVTCLTCLDAGNEDFGDEKDVWDEDGVFIGVRFIEKVVFKLAEIVL
ncbi:het-s domain-containing protein [Cordyceps javanica]|uniref:Het-s domain-containing protein n=1 Tax=Cordyceps javanica TaxID=43265 RepID=A0A545W8C8_9HYPO|nr:het-s domain-containing protein [Cordyceps javanica]TQW10192.1 het-s domain protein [Cordyceps javanica]